MPSKTSEFIKNEVIRLHLLGHTNANVAQMAGTSTGNVSNTINKFKQEVDTGEYQSIRILANLCKNNNLTPSIIYEGAATNNFLEKKALTEKTLRNLSSCSCLLKKNQPFTACRFFSETM